MENKIVMKKEEIIVFLKKMNILTSRDKEAINDLISLFDEGNKKRINKENIFYLIDKFDLTMQIEGYGNLFFIILIKNMRLNIDKKDIMCLLGKFDLMQQDQYGWNVLRYLYLLYSPIKLLFPTKTDFLKIIDFFDLTQRDNMNNSIWDVLIEDYHNGKINKIELSQVISKLDIEMNDKNGNNILIEALKNDLVFDNQALFDKILRTENKNIIDFVYKNLHQINWKQEGLLVFLKKNNLFLDINVLF